MTKRRLEGIGALQLQHDRWILPYTSEHEQFLSKISTDLARQQNSGYISLWQAANDVQQHNLIHKFQDERQQEYNELKNQEHQFLQALAQDICTEQWTFDKLEIHEHTLHKLLVRLRSIQQRDFFHTQYEIENLNLFDQCDQLLYDFAITVYTYHNILHQNE